MDYKETVLSNEGTLRCLRIIIFALVLGVVVFGIIAIVVSQNITPLVFPFPIVTCLGLFMAMSLLFTRFAVMKWQMRRVRLKILQERQANPSEKLEKSSELEKQMLLQALVRITINGAAMLEGPAFFNLICYILERKPAALAIAVLLIFYLALQYPTSWRVDKYLEEQTALLEQETL